MKFTTTYVKHRMLPLLSFLSLGFVATAAVAAPQDRGYYPGNGYGQVVRCESQDAKYRHCAADTRGGVELIRGLSRTYCTEGRNWGWDRNGIWVTGGCRAEFRTRGGGGWGGGGWNGGGWNGGSQIVRCDSNDERHRTCAIPRGGHVRLHRQISKTRCTEGYNWGRERDRIWVSGGCRAEFEVGGRGGGWNGGNGNNGGGWGGGDRVVRCDSNDNRTRRCDAYVRRGARLERQISKSPCIEGRSWGWDRNGIWVSGGCRGEFSVW